MSSTAYQKMKPAATKQLAVLIDPDKLTPQKLEDLITDATNARVDFFFVGGSLLTNNSFEHTVTTIKEQCNIPIIIFPGNNYQLSAKADAVLFLSLISGRNAEYLIGQQVVAAPIIKAFGLETISVGYILIDGGRTSTTSYITQTLPVPNDRPDMAAATALAGEMLGMQSIYLEAGSGALNTVSEQIIQAVKNTVSVPLIVGGGIRTAEQAEAVCRAGADIVVIGNVLEKSPELLMDVSLAVHQTNKANK